MKLYVRLGTGILLGSALLLSGTSAHARMAVVPVPVTARIDPREAPMVVPLPATFCEEDSPITVQARLSRGGSELRAMLWTKGEMDHEYHDVPMVLEGDLLTARLGPWPTRGKEVRYYIELKDAAGRTMTTGDRTSPYVVHYVVPAEEIAEAERTPFWWKLGAVGLLFGLTRLVVWLQRFGSRASRLRAAERRSRLAYPSADLEGSI